MGCDIHSYVEEKIGSTWDNIDFHPFRDRNYGVFAFLAGVRNYSGITPIHAPRGLPKDIAFWTQCSIRDWDADAHTHSWLSAKELLDFDYDSMVEDRRVTRQTGSNSWDGGCTTEPGNGQFMTWREFLGDYFCRDLAMLRAAGDPDKIRVVFWFDN